MIWLGRGIFGRCLPVVCLMLPSYSLALDPSKAITQYVHHVWQVEQGLPQNSVYAIEQTRDGYIWIGTEEGLARFDGVRFKVFQRQNTPEFRHSFVASLLESSDGSLWIGTYEGLMRLKDNQFSTWTTSEGLSNNIVTAIQEDHDGAIWIGTRSGLSRFKNSKFINYKTTDGLSDNNIISLLTDSHGKVWIGTVDGGLNLYDDGKFTTFPDVKGLSNDTIFAIYEDADANMWFGTRAGLLRFRERTFMRITTADGLPHNLVRSLFQDHEKNLWIGTSGGLSRLHDGKLTNFTMREGLSRNIVLSLYEDREGSLWIGINSGGLNQLQDGKFTPYTTMEGLPDNLVRSVLEDKQGNIWIATDSGLTRLRDGEFTNYSKKDGMSNDTSLSLFTDKNERLWIGTRGGGVNCFSDGKFRILTSADGLSNNFVSSFSEDHDGNLWIGTWYGGLNRLKDGKFTRFTTKEGLSNNAIFSLLTDREGTIWIGTFGGGLSRFRNGSFTTVSTKQGLSSDQIESLYEDRKGDLWVGTNGGGLNRIRNGKIVNYVSKDGLSDDLAWAILEDEDENLWMSSNRGIFRVSKKELNDFADRKITRITSVLYGLADGMKSTECNGGSQPSGWKTRDGKLWFPTIRGLVVVDPKRIRKNNIIPPVTMEEVFVDGQVVSTRTRVILPPGKKNLEFHYTALSFRAPERVQFRYKLEGYDQNWIDAGARRVAYYTNLPPESYSFQVIAGNDDGIWNEAGVTFPFILQPRFYQTRWFFLLCIASAGFLIRVIYRIRLGQIQTRLQERFSGVLSERTRLAREIHDTLAQGLSGIAVRLEVVSRTMEDAPAKAIENLRIAQQMAKSSLGEARRFIWDLRPAAFETAGLADALKGTAEELVKGTPVQIDFSLIGVPRAVSSIVENNLLRIGQEAVTNAIKHGKPGLIRIQLNYADHSLQLRIKDNGQGFDPATSNSKESGSFGLVGMRERIAQLGGDLVLRSQPGEGAELTVTIPIRAI